MKASVNKEPEVFKPVKLSLIFETKEELSLFSEMISCDVRIPNLLEREGVIQDEDIPKLSSIMYTIYQGLNP